LKGDKFFFLFFFFFFFFFFLFFFYFFFFFSRNSIVYQRHVVQISHFKECVARFCQMNVQCIPKNHQN